MCAPRPPPGRRRPRTNQIYPDYGIAQRDLAGEGVATQGFTRHFDFVTPEPPNKLHNKGGGAARGPKQKKITNVRRSGFTRNACELSTHYRSDPGQCCPLLSNTPAWTLASESTCENSSVALPFRYCGRQSLVPGPNVSTERDSWHGNV